MAGGESIESLWDEIADTRLEIETLDEQQLYRLLGDINHIADRRVSTMLPQNQKPLLAIMDYCQEARRRLING